MHKCGFQILQDLANNFFKKDSNFDHSGDAKLKKLTLINSCLFNISFTTVRKTNF